MPESHLEKKLWMFSFFMTGIALFTSGWAGSSFWIGHDVNRIDERGGKATIDLSVRMTRLENTMEITLKNIYSELAKINGTLAEHTKATN